jgi:uncharacterized membrane protein
VNTRVVFVDLLRFVAAIQMLQGHTIAALLAPEYRRGPWFSAWSTARGLTSVAFLFAAGLSFYLATERAQEPAAADSGRRRRVVRALRLVALGYLLHLPVAALTASDPGVRTAALHEFVTVDVLQCIGASMLWLELVRALLPTLRARVRTALVLAAGLLACAPLAAQLSATGVFRPLLAYLSSRAGSMFPLSPWAAHVLVGFACGAAIRAPARRVWPTSVAVRVAVLAALASLVAALCFASDAPRVVSDHTSRLAGVLAAAWVLSLIGGHLARVPNLIATLAQHTLILYVFHVLLVYGQGVGLAAWLGPRLGPAGAVLMALFVIALSSALALAYDRLARARGTG